MNHYLVMLTIEGARQVRIDEHGNVGIEVVAEDDEAFAEAMENSEVLSDVLDGEALH